jgi:cytochrome c556
MSNRSRKLAPIALIAAACLFMSSVGSAHFDEDEIAQSYRQSWFAMVAVNFSPMVAMLKGEMPWSDEAMKSFSGQLATLTSMDISRSFADGTDKGTTRAKPEIWENKADFKQKMEDLTAAVNALQTAAAGSDKKAIGAQVGAVGKACKACHDEYKSKNHLY